jgi:hypothetical protein
MSYEIDSNESKWTPYELFYYSSWEEDATLFNSEAFSSLSRNAKGYCFEICIQAKLKQSGIDCSGNPLDFGEWRKHTNKGYDVRIANGLTIECKFMLRKVAQSWFKRDWLSRTADIFVTNDKTKLPSRLQLTLFNLGKAFFSVNELIDNLQNQAFQTYPNKLCLNGDVLDGIGIDTKEEDSIELLRSDFKSDAFYDNSVFVGDFNGK